MTSNKQLCIRTEKPLEQMTRSHKFSITFPNGATARGAIGLRKSEKMLYAHIFVNKFHFEIPWFEIVKAIRGSQSAHPEFKRLYRYVMNQSNPGVFEA